LSISCVCACVCVCVCVCVCAYTSFQYQSFATLYTGDPRTYYYQTTHLIQHTHNHTTHTHTHTPHTHTTHTTHTHTGRYCTHSSTSDWGRDANSCLLTVLQCFYNINYHYWVTLTIISGSRLPSSNPITSAHTHI